jgi:Fe-S-cluster containining protein
MLTPEEHAAFLQSADQVEQAVLRHLQRQRSRPQVIAFVANLQRGVSQVMDTAQAQGLAVACKEGCHHCCSARVEALAPEVFLIARELAGLAAAARQQLLQRLAAHRIRSHEAGAWGQRPPCPFLVNDLCSIYAVRPSACRKAHLLALAQCQENAAQIPQSLAVVVGAEALAKGTAAAYRQLGVDSAWHELGGAVLLALSDPTAESRWYAGESVFEVAADAP